MFNLFNTILIISIPTAPNAAKYPKIITYVSSSKLLIDNINIAKAGIKSVKGTGRGNNNRQDNTIKTIKLNLLNNLFEVNLPLGITIRSK